MAARPPARHNGVDWRRVGHNNSGPLERIKQDDTNGSIGCSPRSVRGLLCRQPGFQVLDDRVHDIFVAAVLGIEHYNFRNPNPLIGYVRTIIRHQGILMNRNGVDGASPRSLVPFHEFCVTCGGVLPLWPILRQKGSEIFKTQPGFTQAAFS